MPRDAQARRNPRGGGAEAASLTVSEVAFTDDDEDSSGGRLDDIAPTAAAFKAALDSPSATDEASRPARPRAAPGGGRASDHHRPPPPPPVAGAQDQPAINPSAPLGARSASALSSVAESGSSGVAVPRRSGGSARGRERSTSSVFQSTVTSSRVTHVDRNVNGFDHESDLPRSFGDRPQSARHDNHDDAHDAHRRKLADARARIANRVRKLDQTISSKRASGGVASSKRSSEQFDDRHQDRARDDHVSPRRSGSRDSGPRLSSAGGRLSQRSSRDNDELVATGRATKPARRPPTPDGVDDSSDDDDASSAPERMEATQRPPRENATRAAQRRGTKNTRAVTRDRAQDQPSDDDEHGPSTGGRPRTAVPSPSYQPRVVQKRGYRKRAASPSSSTSSSFSLSDEEEDDDERPQQRPSGGSRRHGVLEEVLSPTQKATRRLREQLDNTRRELDALADDPRVASSPSTIRALRGGAHQREPSPPRRWSPQRQSQRAAGRRDAGSLMSPEAAAGGRRTGYDDGDARHLLSPPPPASRAKRAHQEEPGRRNTDDATKPRGEMPSVETSLDTADGGYPDYRAHLVRARAKAERRLFRQTEKLERRSLESRENADFEELRQRESRLRQDVYARRREAQLDTIERALADREAIITRAHRQASSSDSRPGAVLPKGSGGAVSSRPKGLTGVAGGQQPQRQQFEDIATPPPATRPPPEPPAASRYAESPTLSTRTPSPSPEVTPGPPPPSGYMRHSQPAGLPLPRVTRREDLHPASRAAPMFVALRVLEDAEAQARHVFEEARLETLVDLYREFARTIGHDSRSRSREAEEAHARQMQPATVKSPTRRFAVPGSGQHNDFGSQADAPAMPATGDSSPSHYLQAPPAVFVPHASARFLVPNSRTPSPSRSESPGATYGGAPEARPQQQQLRSAAAPVVSGHDAPPLRRQDTAPPVAPSRVVAARGGNQQPRSLPASTASHATPANRSAGSSAPSAAAAVAARAAAPAAFPGLPPTTWPDGSPRRSSSSSPGRGSTKGSTTVAVGVPVKRVVVHPTSPNRRRGSTPAPMPRGPAASASNASSLAASVVVAGRGSGRPASAPRASTPKVVVVRPSPTVTPAGSLSRSASTASVVVPAAPPPLMRSASAQQQHHSRLASQGIATQPKPDRGGQRHHQPPPQNQQQQRPPGMVAAPRGGVEQVARPSGHHHYHHPGVRPAADTASSVSSELPSPVKAALPLPMRRVAEPQPARLSSTASSGRVTAHHTAAAPGYAMAAQPGGPTPRVVKAAAPSAAAAPRQYVADEQRGPPAAAARYAQHQHQPGRQVAGRF